MIRIRTIGLLALLLICSGQLFAQDKESRPSPPRTVEAELPSGKVVIDYSSPAVKGRTIWGELVPYEKIWRTGANEATTIMFEKDVKVGGKVIPAGKYALFTIPGKGEWTIILNSEWDQWGAYNYDQKKDVHRFQVSPQMVAEGQERLTIDIAETGYVSIRWEKLNLSFMIE